MVEPLTVATAVLLLVFILVEHRVRHPMLDLHYAPGNANLAPHMLLHALDLPSGVYCDPVRISQVGDRKASGRSRHDVPDRRNRHRSPWS